MTSPAESPQGDAQAPQPREAGRGGMLSSATLTLLTRLAAFVFSLATNVILARSLGPEGRGIYAVAVMVSAIAALLAQLGVGPATVYYLSKQLIDLDELIGHAVALSLILGVLFFGALWLLISLTNSAEFLGIPSRYALIACSALPFSLLTVFFQGIMQGQQRFLQFNLVLLAQYVTPTFTLGVALLVLHRGTGGAVGAWTAGTIATALVAIACFWPPSRLSIRLRVSTLKSLFRFGLISYLGTVTSFVNYRFDVILVNLFAGARQVGLYAVGTGLAEIVWYISNAASVVLAPRVAAAAREEADRITEVVSRIVGLLALSAALVLGLLAPVIVVLFFGRAFADSKWAVWLLLPGIVTFSVGRILSMYLLGRNKLKVDLLASSVGLVVTVALDLLLIPRMGFRGAAIASSIAYTSAMLVDLVWIVRNSSITTRGLLLVRGQDLRLLVQRTDAMTRLLVATVRNRGGVGG